MLNKFPTMFKWQCQFHFRPKCVWKWKSLRRVWLFATPWTGILQARILEWVAFSFSSESSQPRDQTQVCIAGRFLPSWATREAQNTGVGSLSLLQQIFPTQELNQGLVHCRLTLNQLSYQGSPKVKVTQSHLTLCNPMDYTVHGILLARILE